MKSKSPSENSFMTQVFLMIPVGKKNAIPMKRLADLLDIDDRELRQIVQELRMSGSVICGCTKGYFRPSDNMQEVFGFYKYHRQRAMTNLRSLKATRAFLLSSGFYTKDDLDGGSNVTP